jgi:26S proteasome regulatory subunit N5
MALYYERSQAYTAMARCWYEIFLTIPEEAGDFAKLMASTADGGSFFSTAARSSVVRALEHPESKVHALSNAIVFALMAPHLPAKDVEDMCECCAFSKDSTQNGDGYTWLPKLLQLKFVASDLPGLERILRAFTTQELIRVSLCATVEELCHTHSVLKGRPERRDALMCRLSEHDILCVSKFYKRIRLSRLAELVGLSQDQTENFVMLLVNTNTIYAKMDRIDAVVVFKKQLNPVDVVDQWNTGVEKITALVDRATHLIAKERMIARSEGH